MTTAVYAPFVVCGLLALAGPLLRRLPPGPGAWTVVAAVVSGALGTLWALALLAASLVDDIPALDGEGQFGLPVSDAVSVVALVLLGLAGARVIREARAQRRLRRDLRAVVGPTGRDLLVLPDDTARAFVVPGRPGRIVVTDSMLRALTVAQRRVLVAHEQAHLRARHPSALAVMELAVAANPMMRPALRSAAFLIERHADEAAARAVGDRQLAADALTAAALATVGAPPPPALSFHGVGVVERVAALRAAPRTANRASLAPIAAIMVIGVAAGLLATLDFADLLRRLLGH